MASVFISHSSLDRDLVDSRIVDPLKRHGIEVWYSRDSIHAAEEWEKRIRTGLISSDWFLVALTRHSVASEWVRAEVDWALENRRGKVVPVLLDDCNPEECHLRLRQLQYIDMRRGDSAAEASLLRVWAAEANGATAEKSDIVAGAAANISGGKRTDKRRDAGPVHWTRRPAAWAAAAVALVAAAVIARSFFPKTTRPNPAEGPAIQSGDVTALTTSKAAAVPKASPSAAPAEPPPLIVELGLATAPRKEQPPVNPEAAGLQPKPEDDDLQLTYVYDRQAGPLHIGFHLPYFERQRAGKLIQGVSLKHAAFEWAFPVLSVKVLNNSPRSVMLTEVVAQVTKSEIDSQAVLVVGSGTVNALLLVNEGWGDVVDPVLTFKISSLKKKSDSPAVERRTLELKTFSTDCLVPLAKYVPDELDDESSAQVDGALEFGPKDGRHKVPFSTWIIFDIAFEAAVPPSYSYDLALTAGKAPDTVRVPIAQSIKPGEADQFLLHIASDKSAHYELKLGFRQVGGGELPSQDVVLDLFVPRTEAKHVKQASPAATTPSADTAPADKAPADTAPAEPAPSDAKTP